MNTRTETFIDNVILPIIAFSMGVFFVIVYMTLVIGIIKAIWFIINAIFL